MEKLHLSIFTIPLYVWDSTKILKFRFNKTDGEHEYKEPVMSAKNTFENILWWGGGGGGFVLHTPEFVGDK
jgi:hypothetical protein